MRFQRYTQKSSGIRELLTSDETRAVLTDKAQAVEAAAKSSAPVASGAYRDSIHIEQDTTDRAVTRVVSDAPHAFVVQANTGNLARALDAAR